MYNIRTYYKDKMASEMRWLSILFAVFSICYGLRTGYQFGLGQFKNIIPNMVVRWHFVNLVPIIFDLFPICAILIMHHLNFRQMPRKDSSGGSMTGRHPYHENESQALETEEEEHFDNLLPRPGFE